MSLKKNELYSLLPRGHRMLDYPIDARLLLRKKHAIKKDLLLNPQLIRKKIALLGGSTTAEVRAILELFLLNIGIQPEFYESEFNRYYEEAVFENKALAAFKPDIIYLHTTNKNISAYPQLTDSMEAISALLQQEQEKYKAIWFSLSQYHCPIIQNNFEFPVQRILGNLDAYEPRGALNYINRLNAFFADEAQARANVYLNDINYIAATLGLTQWFDQQLWYYARYALSYEAIPHLAKSLAAIIGGLFGLSKKCLVLDLDNTCWGGNIADDGLTGISIGKESALAEAYSEFQRYVKSLKARGIVLTVCSKNEAEHAQEAFKHPDMLLRLDDFAAFAANWEPKYQNILKIAQTVDLSLDSLVFIDDNPAERQLVRDNLAAVSVPDLGNDVLYFMDHLDKNYYFETISLSEDDLARGDFYKRKADGLAQRGHFVRYEDYLDSLLMRADIQPFSPIYMERITQLINKTNQFNLTSKRYALAEVEAISQGSAYLTLYGRLEDRYGDNGLVSVLIGRMHEHECHIDLWLMSCRVLKRTLEYAMFDALVSQCKSMGIETIIGYYYKTPKNNIVANLYEELGFVPHSLNNTGSTWCLHLNGYTTKNYHIKVKK